jgi:hypothetical protein
MLRHTLEHQLTEAASASKPMTYLSIVEKIQTESCRQIGFQAYSLPGPGSEYSNAAKDTSLPRKTASGTTCSVCGKGGHGKDRCWEKGRGAEGQKPAWMVMRDAERTARRSANLKPNKNERPKPNSASPNHPTELANTGIEYDEEYCFASLEEISDETTDEFAQLETLEPTNVTVQHENEGEGEYCLAALKAISEEVVMTAGTSGSALMDSGTTSHVIRNRDAFWTYDVKQRPNVRSVCQGNLQTLA